MRGKCGVILLLTVGLSVAGCGSGGEGAQGGESTVPTTVLTSGTAPSTTESPMAAKARTATFQPADFPPGFQAQPDEPGQGLQIERLWAELTGCLGVDTTAQRTGMATSPTFLRGLATQARSTVEYTAESAANAIATALQGPKFQACANTAFNADVKRSAPEGGVPGPVAVAPLAAPPVAPKTTSFRVTVTLSLDELKVPLFQDFLVVFERGAVIRMLFLNPGSEFPQDLKTSLVEKVVGRV